MTSHGCWSSAALKLMLGTRMRVLPFTRHLWGPTTDKRYETFFVLRWKLNVIIWSRSVHQICGNIIPSLTVDHIMRVPLYITTVENYWYCTENLINIWNATSNLTQVGFWEHEQFLKWLNIGLCCNVLQWHEKRQNDQKKCHLIFSFRIKDCLMSAFVLHDLKLQSFHDLH